MIRMRSRSSRRMVPTKRSAIALARGARIGVLSTVAPVAVKTLLKAAVNEGGGELGVAVPDQEPEASTGVVEVHQQVAGLLGEPGAGGVSGDAEDVYAAGGMLDDDEDMQPVQGGGVEMAQVAGQDRVRLRGQEFGPRGSGAARAGSMPELVRIFQTVEAPIW